ncbi:MAG: N-acetylmuramidase domain-containing protein [Ferruginibacter sp.]
MREKIEQYAREVARNHGLNEAMFLAFVEVESGGLGFDPATGKIIIQFEPVWFKRLAPYAPSGLWSVNKVSRQSAEWIAFNDAFKKNPNAAMESTSIGLPQIMGFHYKRLGYKKVGGMWDDFKVSERNQLQALAKFIKTDSSLLNAIQQRNYHVIASIYNGANYAKMAKVWGREPYNISLQKAFNRYNRV